MVISYHGAEFFKITFGDLTLAFNPIAKDSKYKPTKFGADIAFVTINHPDMNGVDQVAFGDKTPFVVSTPGEYEVRDILIGGYPTKSAYDAAQERINTVYYVTLEGMKLCFLGAVSDKALSPEVRQHVDNIDILFVPIGGNGVLEPAEAHELAVELEPKIIIPMHYSAESGKNALDAFLKEESENVKPVDKLTLKRKDLEGKQGEVMVLSV